MTIDNILILGDGETYGYFTAGAALVPGVVHISGTNKALINTTTSAAVTPLGVVIASATSGDAGILVYSTGVVELTAGEAISAGNLVYPKTGGRVMKTGASGAKVGVALTTAANSGAVLVKLQL